MKINSISASSKSYPVRLSNIPDKPLKLYLRGNLPGLTPAVAIVGTRKPTAYGKQITTELAEGLARRGVVVISGMAIGIDGVAHEAAVRAGGITIAVLACGIDKPYPASHRQLAENILRAGGSLISEYEPGVPVMQYRLLRRNRLISGLSDALVVTEASQRSGTMNTVSHALAQGRDVFAVPGPINSPTSAGCNQLIAQGAQPVVSVEAFLERFAPSPKQIDPEQVLLLAQDKDEQILLTLIQGGVSDGENLARQSGLEPSRYQQTMTMLEIRGTIRSQGANHWSL